MRFKTILLFLLALTLATTAWAQTKISGTLQCGKSDPSYAIPVGDRPGHVFAIRQTKCIWTTAPEIAGTQAKEHEYTLFVEVSGARGRYRSAAVGTMASGDRYYTSTQGTTTVKEGLPRLQKAPGTSPGAPGSSRASKEKGPSRAQPAPMAP